MRGFFVYTWLFSGVIGLEWTTGTIPDNTTLYECEGQNVTLFWNFSAGVGERVESIKWYFKPDNLGEILLAIKTDDYFTSTDKGNQRLFHDENARLTISSLKSSDFGRYVVRVFVVKNEAAIVHSRAATIALPVPPVIANEKLTVRLLPETVRQGSTGKWHVQLACGSFLDIGKPESDVVWETPWNKEIQSTQHEKDIFILTIPNPVQTGNYTCKLRVSNNTERCGGLSARLQRKALFELHATDARLLILDAENQAFQKELQNLKAEITVLCQTVSTSKDKLSALEGRVGSEITVLNKTVSASKDKLSALEGRVGSEITVLNKTVSTSKDKLLALEGRVGSEITVLNKTLSTSKDKLSALEGRVGSEITVLSQTVSDSTHKLSNVEGRFRYETTILSQTLSASKDTPSALEGRFGSEITVLNQTVSASNNKMSALESRVGCQTGIVEADERGKRRSPDKMRYMRKRINFNKRFVGTPIVSASFSLIDSSRDHNMRIWSNMEAISSTGFDLYIREWSNTWIYRVIISWIACSSY